MASTRGPCLQSLRFFPTAPVEPLPSPFYTSATQSPLIISDSYSPTLSNFPTLNLGLGFSLGLGGDDLLTIATIGSTSNDSGEYDAEKDEFDDSFGLNVSSVIDAVLDSDDDTANDSASHSGYDYDGHNDSDSLLARTECSSNRSNTSLGMLSQSSLSQSLTITDGELILDFSQLQLERLQSCASLSRAVSSSSVTSSLSVSSAPFIPQSVVPQLHQPSLAYSEHFSQPQMPRPYYDRERVASYIPYSTATATVQRPKPKLPPTDSSVFHPPPAPSHRLSQLSRPMARSQQAQQQQHEFVLYPVSRAHQQTVTLPLSGPLSRSLPSSPQHQRTLSGSSRAPFNAYSPQRSQHVQSLCNSPIHSKHAGHSLSLTSQLTPRKLQMIDTAAAAPRKDSVASANRSSTTTLQGDSPSSKAKFKSFYKDFWALTKKSTNDSVTEYGMRCYHSAENHSIRWRVAMELADYYKRSNMLDTARHWFTEAAMIEPHASQIWLEHSKMEEEYGHWAQSKQCLVQGLEQCPDNDALSIKLLKLLEKLGLLAEARQLLGKLRSASLDRVCKTVVEGVTMEARAGNIASARRVMHCLLYNVSWFGPLYVEAATLEMKLVNGGRAMRIIERGLSLMPRFGPLWFTAIQAAQCPVVDMQTQPDADSDGDQLSLICAKTSTNNDWLSSVLASHSTSSIDCIRSLVQCAVTHVSSELVWKLYLLLALEEMKYREFDRARAALLNAVGHCSKGLRWKVWLMGARLELLALADNATTAGATERVKQLLDRAEDEIPSKMYSTLVIEYSRYYEYFHDFSSAYQLLIDAIKQQPDEWKIQFELILLLLRNNDSERAEEVARQSIERNSNTGRLWSILVQIQGLNHTDADADAQYRTFRAGLLLVPKSGELYCEGARIAMNPSQPHRFSLVEAHRYLGFALLFTPQYADSYIEIIRLKLLVALVGTEGSRMRASELDFNRVERLACHSQPNYGSHYQAIKNSLVSHAKIVNPTITDILHFAKRSIAKEIDEHWEVYLRAFRQSQAGKESGGGDSDGVQPSEHHRQFLRLLYPAIGDLHGVERYHSIYNADPLTP